LIIDMYKAPGDETPGKHREGKKKE
jgi:hypothetical protein